MRKTPNKELNRLTVEEFKQRTKIPIVVVLDNVRSAHNVGSSFRTSDAFLINKMMLCGITVKPPHKDLRKTALGASESVNWQYQENTLTAITELKKEGYTIIAIEQADNSVQLNQFVPDTTKKYALVFGHEVNGVSDDVMNMVDSCIEIPQYGTKHSLNISVSVGIVLWEISNKLNR
jgi:23S rRNA (guanosine2251-2'-O)-methyltransferase